MIPPQQQPLAQNASVSENGPITVNNINSAGLDRSQPQELPGASGMSDQLPDQSQQEEGGEQSPEQPQYQPLDPSVQAAPVSEDGPLSVNDNIPAGLDHRQSQEPLGASGGVLSSQISPRPSLRDARLSARFLAWPVHYLPY